MASASLYAVSWTVAVAGNIEAANSIQKQTSGMGWSPWPGAKLRAARTQPGDRTLPSGGVRKHRSWESGVPAAGSGYGQKAADARGWKTLEAGRMGRRPFKQAGRTKANSALAQSPT
jgi:hypothetical protein